MSATERRAFERAGEAGVSDAARAAESAQLRPLLNLLGVLETQAPDHAGHGDLVGAYCVITGESLGLDHDRVDSLLLAGTFHDIGKLSLDAEILAEQGPLNTQQWIQVQRHPELGADFLVSAGLGEISRWVLAHHERPDGLGYPFGLRDAEIPLEAKILAVADSYDAMRTERVYRAAMSHEQAVEELRRNCGTQFDSEVVDAILRALAGLER
jgi:HD-GYP domain-containing protein (c-di-GMP phosphodiesterase class II)